MADLPRVALIAGPTASGKSALALALAEAHDGVVINADASQVYRDLRILSARPSAEEEAHAPHRLFGYRDAADPVTAAAWAADARAAVAEAHAAGRLPILVGGTGLYLRTLLDGIAPVPAIDPAIRGEIRTLPVTEAYHRLHARDPQAAARLAPADTTRVQRALEVVEGTGRTLGEWQRERTGGIGAGVRLAAAVLLPPRPWLADRCDRRLEAMFADGAEAEVAALLARDDVPPDSPALRAIGVAELGAMLAGTYTRGEALAAAQTATRQYAKRQYTWFRNQPPPEWLRTDAVDTRTQLQQFETKLLD